MMLLNQGQAFLETCPSMAAGTLLPGGKREAQTGVESDAVRSGFTLESQTCSTSRIIEFTF